MLSKAERDFLMGKITTNTKYSRILRWRIRKKVERMKNDLRIIESSGLNLARSPVKAIQNSSQKQPIAFVTTRKKENYGKLIWRYEFSPSDY